MVKKKNTLKSKTVEKKSKVKDLNDKNKALKSEISSLMKKYDLLQAEYANYKRRTLDEKFDLMKYSGQDAICEFLSVYDDMKRMMESEKKNKVISDIEGYKLIYKKFSKVLTELDVIQIQSIGKNFDPNLHEALMQKKSNKPSGLILEEFESGYKFHDKIIRHAKVIVSKGKKS
tara:strand:- start:502 stop:1023 length:522 start_codon:yes stop_codon:yes gene_type:complete